MMKRSITILSVLLMAGVFTSCSTAEFKERVPGVERTQFADHESVDWRDLRYGEVIPVFRKGTKLYMEVYNTVTSNELPDELWRELDAEEMAEEYGAEMVILNGPRYWVINKMDGKGVTANGKVANFGGIEMTQRATLENSVFKGAIGSSSYSEKTVERSTEYTYFKENMVYEITNDKGGVYRMQSYSQIFDSNLTIDDLEFLGDRLELPEGWSYTARVLEEDSKLLSDGSTTVITDEFGNTYQKIAEEK